MNENDTPVMPAGAGVLPDGSAVRPQRSEPGAAPADGGAEAGELRALLGQLTDAVTAAATSAGTSSPAAAEGVPGTPNHATRRTRQLVGGRAPSLPGLGMMVLPAVNVGRFIEHVHVTWTAGQTGWLTSSLLIASLHLYDGPGVPSFAAGFPDGMFPLDGLSVPISTDPIASASAHLDGSGTPYYCPPGRSVLILTLPAATSLGSVQTVDAYPS